MSSHLPRPNLGRLARRRRIGGLVAVVALGLAACGGDDDGGIGDLFDAAQDAADGDDEGVADAFGIGGGGGTLVFDGQEIAIDSAVCSLDGELFDVGTVSADGSRVFVSWTNEQNPQSIQILDADFLQWFPDGDDVIERDGTTFSSPPLTYFNNSDDRTVEASFTIECP